MKFTFISQIPKAVSKVLCTQTFSIFFHFLFFNNFFVSNRVAQVFFW